MPAYTVEVQETTWAVEVTGDDVTVEIADSPVVLELTEAGPQGPAGVTTPPVFSRAGLLAPEIGALRYYLERTGTITRVRASVGTPSSGSGIVVDVLLNGASILGGTPLTTNAGQFTNTRTVAVPVAAGDYLTVSILAVGSGSSGADLTVSVTLD